MNCLLLECRRRGNSNFELGKFQQMGSGKGKREMYSTSAMGYSMFVVCFGGGTPCCHKSLLSKCGVE